MTKNAWHAAAEKSIGIGAREVCLVYGKEQMVLAKGV